MNPHDRQITLVLGATDALLLQGHLRLDRERFVEADNEVMVGMLDRVEQALETAQTSPVAPRTSKSLHPGMIVRIKPQAWERYLQENELPDAKPIPAPQPIEVMPSNPPFNDRVMLAWPHYWWTESDLEPVQP